MRPPFYARGAVSGLRSGCGGTALVVVSCSGLGLGFVVASGSASGAVSGAVPGASSGVSVPLLLVSFFECVI